MGKFTHLMLHATATPEGREVTREDIEHWHIHGRGWSRVGYSTLFQIKGSTEILIPFDADGEIESWEISNGARGWNGRTRHYAYAGGTEKGSSTPKDTRNAVQLAAMETAIKYEIMFNPDIKLIGHNQVSKKACPSFDVPEWCKKIGIKEKNIDRKIYH